MSTILHVEDDAALAETVKFYFEALGFHGAYVIANTLAAAGELLASNAVAVDLIIADMNLPDGSGLDLVRRVRANPERAHVPIVVLSGQVDREVVDEAYVLGANSYVSKGMRDRPISEIMNALYEHWLHDARLPSATPTSRTQQYLCRGVRLNARRASIDMQIAQQLGPELGEFWMNLALRSGNLSNILAFLAKRVDRELPHDLLEEGEQVQRRVDAVLDGVDHRPVMTLDDARRYMRRLVEDMRFEVADRVLAELFPNTSVATATLRRIAAATLDEMAAWIDTNASDAGLRRHIGELRGNAARLRASMVTTPAHPAP